MAKHLTTEAQNVLDTAVEKITGKLHGRYDEYCDSDKLGAQQGACDLLKIIAEENDSDMMAAVNNVFDDMVPADVPHRDEVIAGLRDELLDQAQNGELSVQKVGAAPEITPEVTELVLEDIAETMGGEAYGWDTERVVAFSQAPDEFKEKYPEAHASFSAATSLAMARHELSGGEQAPELNEMISNYEQHLQQDAVLAQQNSMQFAVNGIPVANNTGFAGPSMALDIA